MIRKADNRDIEILVNHHCHMFLELWEIENKAVDLKAFKVMELNYRDKLVTQLADGSCIAWVALQDMNIVASAAISIYHGVPTPYDPNIDISYLHSVYTIQTERRKGFARSLVKHAMDFCKERGIRRIDLFASSAGLRLYESLGFEKMNAAMRYISK